MFRLASRAVAAVAVAAAFAGSATAAVTFTYAPYGVPTGLAQVKADVTLAGASGGSENAAGDENRILTFGDAAAGGFTFTQSGPAGLFSGANGLVPGIAAPPATGPTAHDMGLYEALQNGGVFDLKTPLLETFSVYVGSLDRYNEITFKGPNGFSESFWGNQLYAGANGDQRSANTNGRFTFSFGGKNVNEVIFSSAGNSFEFNYLAASVPEPSTWMLAISGLALAGAALRRRVREASSACA